MTFSFYHSVRSVPSDQREVATAYHFTWWKRLVWVELPFSTIGLVWNSMMSMAGGWFFLMVSEAFVLGDKDFRLPGLGSYMSVAVARGDGAAMGWAVLAMALMIVVLDQLLWRPVVVWAQKFRVEEGGQEAADRDGQRRPTRSSGSFRSNDGDSARGGPRRSSSASFSPWGWAWCGSQSSCVASPPQPG